MTSNELRQAYLNFFKEKGHSIIPSASLIPENDPTVLFTTAGMHPLVPYLLGESHPAGRRLVDVQKCIRTGDIDEVGDKTHHTFFEMLGNWSLQDYFKKESIAWSFEFLTKTLKLPLEKLAFTVFEGEGQIPRDNESADLWKSFGVSEKRIAFLGREDNWWGPAGQTGPCGPDTEIFFWTGEDIAPEVCDPKDKKWVEIWNNVFMQYNKTIVGEYEPLAKPSVDTGMGLERTLAVINGFDDNYRTELFWPIIQEVEKLAEKKYQDYQKEFRIIVDHLRAATVIISDGVLPSNKDQGYILRRLIRRAVRYGKILGINKPFLAEVSKTVVRDLGVVYKELAEKSEIIFDALAVEEEKFSQTLEKGLKKMRSLVLSKKESDAIRITPFTKTSDLGLNIISGVEAFDLFQTFGFPPEMVKEELYKIGEEEVGYGFSYDEEEFQKAFSEHKDLSRSGAEQKFAGGLADHSVETTKLHTATHLLQAALRKILGPHVFQKGSNITVERLRFDFSHPEKVTSEQLEQVEQIVNRAIEQNLPVSCQMMDLAEAKVVAAIGVFDDKYEKLGGQVKVYTIGPSTIRQAHGSAGSGQVVENSVSREVCGGPHVEKTGDLGHFKIIKEEAVSAGVRRIKAVLA